MAKDESKHQVIVPPNLLKVKVTGGGGVDPEALARVEAQLSDPVAAAKVGIASRIASLRSGHQALSAAISVDANAAQIRTVAEEIAALARDAGFAFLHRLAVLLAEFVARTASFRDIEIQVIRAHIDALATALDGDLAEDGGAAGPTLIAALEEVARGAGR